MDKKKKDKSKDRDRDHLNEDNNGTAKAEKDKLPYCTTAPSAEHARASDEDEPCDDGREGNIKKD